VTPLRIWIRSRYVAGLNFMAVTRALLPLLHLMRMVLVGSPAHSNRFGPLLALAKQIRTRWQSLSFSAGCRAAGGKRGDPDERPAGGERG
jgi:hypothetical protein